jgi:ribose transport system permease protein
VTVVDRAATVDRESSVLSVLKTSQKRLPIAQLVGIVACLLYGAAQVPSFLSSANLITIAVLASLLTIAAFGQTALVIIGGIDLSIGSLISAGAVLVPFYSDKLDLSFVLVAVIGVALAAAVGAISGAISSVLEAHPLIVTLAVGACLQGVILVATQGAPSGVMPEWVSSFTLPSSQSFGVPIPPVVVVCVLAAVVGTVLLYRTILGRHLYALGTNPQAARLALVRTRAVWISLFAFSAAMGLLAGIAIGSFSGSGDVSVGNSYLFLSVAAVLIGGTPMEGGRGDFVRTLVGALLLTCISTTLTSLNYPSAYIQVLSGALIFLVAANSSREQSARDRV